MFYFYIFNDADGLLSSVCGLLKRFVFGKLAYVVLERYIYIIYILNIYIYVYTYTYKAKVGHADG